LCPQDRAGDAAISSPLSAFDLTKLDFAVVSHRHDDHTSGLS
jgi:metal-dependent hydrolase (beta-lactamase superfamily II)